MTVRVMDLLVAIVIGSMVMGGLGAYYVQVNKTYGLNLTDSQFDTFNQINSIVNLSEEQGGAIVGSDIDKEAESVTNFFVGAFNAAKRVLTAPVNVAKVGFSLINDTFSILAQLGIPKVFSFGLGALLTIIITFGLIRGVLKVIP